MIEPIRIRVGELKTEHLGCTVSVGDRDNVTLTGPLNGISFVIHTIEEDWVGRPVIQRTVAEITVGSHLLDVAPCTAILVTPQSASSADTPK